MNYSNYIARSSISSQSGERLADDDPPFAHIPQNLVKPNKKTKIQPQKGVSAQKGLSKTKNSEQSSGFPVKSDLPFDFRYSYSENIPGIEPIGFREPPRFSPFGPGRLDRNWTGTSAPVQGPVDRDKVVEERLKVLGKPLTEEEIVELVEKYRHNNCSRQINLGKGGVTHNTLEDIHNHWKRAECVRIKCLGVPTLDMDNVCFHLECFVG